MAWWQWGEAAAPRVVLCVHGLTRQGRDFDALAQALLRRAQDQGERLRVVCPDIVGRGRSDWLADADGYEYATYVADIHALLLALERSGEVHTFDWVGTSMGGLIGIPIAAERATGSQPALAHLVLNDIGPVMEAAAIRRIGKGLGDHPTFANEAQADTWLRARSLGFGACDAETWRAFSRPQLRALPSGRLALRHDPAVAVGWDALGPQSMAAAEELLWTLYDRIRASTLVVHGADSDLLSAATIAQMTQRGPHAQVVEFAGVGHAPMLVADAQTAPIVRFLLPDY